MPRRRNVLGTTGLPQGLTASAVKVEANTGQKTSLRRLIQAWQQTALSYYDALGECWYPSQFYGRGLARVRLYVATVKDDGEIEPVEANAKADELLRRVQDPGGGRSNMLRTYGQLRFVTGESYLIVTKDGDDEQWEMVSVDELRANPGKGYTRYRAPQLSPEQLADVPDDAYEPLPDSAVVYRFWQRHPRYSALADAPTKAVLELYDLLSRLTAAELADAKSRIANAGILWLADEIKWGETGRDIQDDDPKADPFLTDLTTAMTAPLKNPGEASAFVPMIARIPREMMKEGEKAYDLLKFHDPTETGRQEEIEKTIRRIAAGLDIPPEIMLGLEDTNHWNAWIVQDETWQSHLGPAAQGFCDDLTTAYFRPACKLAKVDGWERLVVAYDATEIINHPDRGKDAQEAFESGAIGFKAYRDARGFTDADAPSEDELRTIVAVLGHNVGALNGDPTEPVPADVVPADDSQDGADAANEVTPGPPEEPVASDQVAASIVAMAEMAVERCRELAGSRMRTKAKACDDCVERLREVPNELVASVLGFEAANDVGAPAPSVLVAGGTASFQRALTKRGVTEEWVSRLAELVELHAARTLWLQAPSLPKSFMEAARRAT